MAAHRLATRSWLILFVALIAGGGLRQEAWPAVSAKEILTATGVQGGLIVHLGCGDGKLTAALLSEGNQNGGDAFLVQGLDADPENVAAARLNIRALGLYGKASVQQWTGKTLPYVDNLVNLVVSENLGETPMDEVLRVLAPLGVAYVKQTQPGAAVPQQPGAAVPQWTKTVKPWPHQIDQWQQYLHDADNNAVAHDAVVGPPRHLQWVTEPAWSRSHMGIPTVVSMVSSHGRLFTIEDTATPEEPFLPGRFSLVARDAFNGIVLWKHAFRDWEPITRYVKDISVQLQRRLAAIGDTVYCTPGLDAPLTAFDAATGRTIKEFQGTERTQEFAYDESVLYLVVGDRMNSARYNIVKLEPSKGISLGGTDPQAPFDGTGFRGAYPPETPDSPDPVCAIVAVEADSGKELWRLEDIHGYVGCTLAIRGQHAVYQTLGGLTCLNRTTGGKMWSVDKQITSGDGTEPNTLVLSDDCVYAQEGAKLCVYRLADGSQKWTGPIAAHYEKSADLFLTGGAVWTGGSGKPTSRDPETGRQLTVITQQMTGPMGHDRCYRNLITDRYYVNSKTGGADFVTLDGKTEFPNHWLRGTCGKGVLPANGLLYVPPYSCQCSMGAMIKDMNALYTEKDIKASNQQIPVERKVQLVKGPAFGQPSILNPQPVPPDAAGGLGLSTLNSSRRPSTSNDWPTYRHDAARSGATASKVPANLTPRWQFKLRTVGSAPVVAAGKVLVSDIDAHTVYALDAADGRVVWEYVAGGRVDSPPTCLVEEGLVLFGSRDGWVHCLRQSDGALVWRFRDLPERMICAFGQLESVWPVSGSVLIRGGVAYFAAGRSSFLDGGIFVYGLNPRTGEVIDQRQVYGPFDKTTGFPATGSSGFKSDVFVADDALLYLRHQAFNPDLSDAVSPRDHVIPSAGFLDGSPQHRTFWTVGTGYGVTLGSRPSGDILVTDSSGKDFYEVRGFPVKRHSYFDPRLSGYKLFAGTMTEAGGSETAARGRKAKAAKTPTTGKWTSDIPLTGKAMVLAGDVVFVAGTPVEFAPDNPVAEYEAAYEGKLGGVLWAASAADGKTLAQVKLDAAPAWDAMAAAYGRLYLSLNNGSVVCLGENRN